MATILPGRTRFALDISVTFESPTERAQEHDLLLSVNHDQETARELSLYKASDDFWRSDTIIEWPPGLEKMELEVLSKKPDGRKTSLCLTDLFRESFENGLPQNAQDTLTTFNVKMKITDDPDGRFSNIPIEEQILALPDDHTQKRDLLSQIGGELLTSFAQTKSKVDLDGSVMMYKKLVQLDPSNSSAHGSLGIALLARSDLIEGDIEDLQHGILALERAQATAADDKDVIRYLDLLGPAYQLSYYRRSDTAVIDKAIAACRKTVELTPEGHSDMRKRLDLLGYAHEWRFERCMDINDADAAIAAKKRVVDLTPENHADAPRYLSRLGQSYLLRFQNGGTEKDVRRAIAAHQKAIHISTNDHDALPKILVNLHECYVSQFERNNDMKYLDSAVAVLRQAIEVTPNGGKEKTNILKKMYDCYYARFECKGIISDVDNAISEAQKAIQLTTSGSDDMASWLYSLGDAHYCRFKRTGSLNDLDESILALQKAVQITPDGHYMNTLCASHIYRFGRTGHFEDIEEAIVTAKRTIELFQGVDNAEKVAGYYANLGASHQRRFDHTKDINDVDIAITAYEKAIQILPRPIAVASEDELSSAGYLNNLGGSYVCRYVCTNDVHNIEEAISSLQRAVELTPAGHTKMLDHVSNLSLAFSYRFWHSQDVKDIEEAIIVVERALRSVPKDSEQVGDYLAVLGSLRERYFQYNRDPKHLDAAILEQVQSINLTPDDHPSMVNRLLQLAQLYASQFGHTADTYDLELMIKYFRLATVHPTGAPSSRLNAARKWSSIFLPFADFHSESFKAYEFAFQLLPEVVWIGDAIKDRHTQLRSLSNFSNEAAAVAISLGEFKAALEWLEQGRCIVWNQLNSLRTSVDDLHEKDPALVENLQRTSKQLEGAGSRQANVTLSGTIEEKISLQTEVKLHRQLGMEWNTLLNQARQLPGFEEFLKPIKFSQLSAGLPHSGYVVILNVHPIRSDALVLVRSSAEPIHIPLVNFSYEKAEDMRKSLNAILNIHGARTREVWLGATKLDASYSNKERARPLNPPEDLVQMARTGRFTTDGHPSATTLSMILSELWTGVVKPILDALEITGNDVSESLPRFWWCATGPLAFLPLHAAGLYTTDLLAPKSKTSDLVVSSYIPSISSIIERRNPSNSPYFSGILAISQPNTPDLPPIPSTTKECQMVLNKFNASSLDAKVLEDVAATVQEVSECMNSYNWIHFACHALQKADDPMKSAFYLQDGRLELASIMDKTIVDADFAFLSACQTSTGDEKLSEEAVHLAAGMLTAGYRSVIATMWSINDNYAPLITEDVYSYLLQSNRKGEPLDSSHAAHALRYATRRVQEKLQDVIGLELALLCSVPYIHMGL
ncbi:CHAT domain-containing protein [Crucibulum laeve]|uniref:CHAT domain-containing protein n=1 Tax=Crucibulum laeve TaxID=68775 RepID=A0A5C3LQ28_9AGAR|nr:CHAT domain-containing protein [Crucibulum laeve]